MCVCVCVCACVHASVRVYVCAGGKVGRWWYVCARARACV